MIALQRGDYEAALLLYREAVAFHALSGQTHLYAVVRGNLGTLLVQMGRLEGNRRSAARARAGLAAVECEAGNLDEAGGRASDDLFDQAEAQLSEAGLFGSLGITRSILHGWWRADSGEILEFSAAKESWGMRGTGSTDAPNVMVSYTALGEAGWQAAMSYDVAEGMLETTILAGVFGGVGMTFSQAILGVSPGDSLEIEVQEGESLYVRSYAAIDRCPRETQAGWFRTGILGCTPLFGGATSVAFDDYGRRHIVASLQGVDSACNTVTAYEVMSKSCSPALYDFPLMRFSAMRIDRDVVHVVYSSRAQYPEDPDARLFYTRRDLDSDVWTTEDLGRYGYESVELGTCTVHVDADTELTVSF